jgi:AMP-binding enzyme C-terminal domain
VTVTCAGYQLPLHIKLPVAHFVPQRLSNCCDFLLMKASLSRSAQELLEHPHISTVAVCGIPDAEYGQAVAAVVVAKPDAAAALTPEGVIAFAKTKVVSYATPRRVVFVQELPVNAMGKVSSGWHAQQQALFVTTSAMSSNFLTWFFCR